MPAQRICSILDCGKPHQARGWCKTHYERWRKYRSPEKIRGKPAQFIRDVALHHWRDECLIWPFGRTTAGYGLLWFDGVQRYAHRLVCELTSGPAPTPAHMAIHSCGRGHDGCVNPGHLRWGTKVENTADAWAHGTVVCGQQHPGAKLSEASVREIRSGTDSLSKTGRAFGVSAALVRKIRRREIWSWLPD